MSTTRKKAIPRALLGTVPDHEIAINCGCNTKSVQRLRSSLGIEPWLKRVSRQCAICYKPLLGRKLRKRKYCSDACVRVALDQIKYGHGICQNPACRHGLTYKQCKFCSKACQYAVKRTIRETREANIKRRGSVMPPYMPEDDAKVAELWGTTETRDIGRIIGRSKNSVCGRVRRLRNEGDARFPVIERTSRRSIHIPRTPKPGSVAASVSTAAV